MNFLIYYLFITMSNSRFARSILMIFTIGHQISIFEFSMIQVGYFASRFLSEFPSGVFADYIKRKYSMAFGSFLAALVSILMFSTASMDLSKPFWWFFLLFCLDGIASSFQSGSDQAMLYDYLRKKGMEGRYAKILGWRGAIGALALGLTTMVGGYLADTSLALPFLWQGILFAASGVLILFFPEDAMTPIKDKVSRTSPYKIAVEGFRVIRTIPLIQFLILFMTILAVSTNAIAMFMQGYFSELSISSTSIGIIYGLCTFCSAVAAVNSHHLTKLSLKTILIIATCMYFVGTFCLLTGVVPLVILGFFMVYLKMDLLDPSVSYFLNQEVHEEVRATVLSSFGAAYSLVTLIMYPLYGLVGESSGYEGMILTTVILSAPLFAFLFRFYKKYNVGGRHTTSQHSESGTA